MMMIMMIVIVCEILLANGQQQVPLKSAAGPGLGSSVSASSPSRDRIISSILHSADSKEDPFQLLSTSELLLDWSKGAERSISSLSSRLLQFQHNLLIEVRLVGFEGVPLKGLQTIFDALPQDHPIYGLDGHRLNTSVRVLYSVSRAPKQLLNAIDEIRKVQFEQPEDEKWTITSHEDTELLLISPTEIHATLVEEYRNRGSRGVVIYIIDEAIETDYPLFAYIPDDSYDENGKLNFEQDY